jgi:hypothetical protein
MQFRLNNEGEHGDKVAGDQIFSHQTMVPPDAPAGTYHIDIVARDKTKNIITTQEQETENPSDGHSDTVVIQVN